MQLDQDLAGFTSDRDSVVAIGVFDGVHLGHKYLIAQLKELAGQQDYSSVVITFDKHPQKVLRPHSHPLSLTDTAVLCIFCLGFTRPGSLLCHSL
jgi:riboflavin kinase / FMN adenylyltransferase